MIKALKLASVSAALFVAMNAPLLAQTAASSRWTPRRPPTVRVPEIDASVGMLAVAAVVAVLMFVYERRRRAA